MDTRNSQKKSRHGSGKSERNPLNMNQEYQPPSPAEDFDLEQHMDHSLDHVARVRAAKEAAQREMESFGDVSEYEVTTIQGQLKEEPNIVSQPSLDFRSEEPTEQRETD